VSSSLEGPGRGDRFNDLGKPVIPLQADEPSVSANRTALGLGMVVILAGLAGCLGADDPSARSASPSRNATPALENATREFAPGGPSVAEAKIRPGVTVAGGCTSNFVFASPDNRTLCLDCRTQCA
jgi:hypothetical protein